MKRIAPVLPTVFLLVLALAATGSGGAGPEPSSSPFGKWIERSAGLLSSRPSVLLSGKEGRLAGETDLAPGDRIEYVLAVDPAGAQVNGLDLSVQASGSNLGSKDYRDDRSRFVFGTTVVFGKDRQEIGWKKRAMQFFGHLWNGFPPRGIRLTYAWGSGAPVGSMIRLSDEETVFVLAGKEEAGKRIESRRMPAADFVAAYGRPPKGGVTGIVVRLDRPSGEKEKVRLSFEVGPTP